MVLCGRLGPQLLVLAVENLDRVCKLHLILLEEVYVLKHGFVTGRLLKQLLFQVS